MRVDEAAVLETPRGCGPDSIADSKTVRPLRQQIFEHVRALGAISRAQIAKELGVSPASVTTLTSELIDVGLLHEISIPRSVDDAGRGRPPVALGVRPEAHLVAGVKLSDQVHTAVIADFAGNEIASATLPATRIGSPSDVLAGTAQLIDAAARRAGQDLHQLSGVGIGLPGLVDHDTGRVYWSPILNARNVAFADEAARALGVPVRIDNDANLVTLSELWFGAGRHLSDFAVVTIEQGVGMGFVSNRALYRGAQGLGLEIGHTKVQLDGALCRCGQRGCLEAYVADYALAREAAQALGQSGAQPMPMPTLLETLRSEAQAGNAAARSIFRRAGRYLAVGIANVVNLFDPELVILSGGQVRHDLLEVGDLLAEMESLSLSAGQRTPRVEVHARGDLLWAHGAAALALSDLTDRVLGHARETAPA
ncbi:MAG: ROK family transcriptional regulator [Pseudomonadota bacterium]